MTYQDLLRPIETYPDLLRLVKTCQDLSRHTKAETMPKFYPVKTDFNMSRLETEAAQQLISILSKVFMERDFWFVLVKIIDKTC